MDGSYLECLNPLHSKFNHAYVVVLPNIFHILIKDVLNSYILVCLDDYLFSSFESIKGQLNKRDRNFYSSMSMYT